MSYFSSGGGTAIDGTVTGATEGSVFFAGVSGVLAQDNANLFWDNSNNRLGVGINSALTSSLEVRASASNNQLRLGRTSDFTGTGSLYANSLRSLGVLNGGGTEVLGIDQNGVLTVPYSASIFTAASSSSVPLLLQLAASQSANAMEVKNSSGAVVFAIASDPDTYGLQLGQAGNGNAIRSVATTKIQLVSSFNAVFEGSLYGPVYANNAYGQQYITPQLVLTSGAAKTVASVSVPTLSGSSGVFHVRIFASDGTDIQNRTQIVRWEAVNKGGAYTTQIAVVSEGVAVSAGTLIGTWSIVSGTNAIDIKLTATSSLTTTTFYVVVLGDISPGASWASS